MQVQNIELPGVLETSGQITYDDRSTSTIISRVQGRIEQTRVSLWDNVQRGEKIVALYSPDFMTAESEYLQAHDTSKLMAAPGVGGSSDFAGALSQAAKRKLQFLGMTDADIQAIKAPDPTVWMRAPISGTVVDNKVQRGAAVNPGDVLFSLGTLNDVWITGDIYEDDLARVRVGQDLSAVTTAFPDEVFHGVIDRISPNVDPTTHTLQIRCVVKNPGGKLKPQMLAKVSYRHAPRRGAGGSAGRARFRHRQLLRIRRGQSRHLRASQGFDFFVEPRRLRAHRLRTQSWRPCSERRDPAGERSLA